MRGRVDHCLNYDIIYYLLTILTISPDGLCLDFVAPSGRTSERRLAARTRTRTLVAWEMEIRVGGGFFVVSDSVCRCSFEYFHKYWDSLCVNNCLSRAMHCLTHSLLLYEKSQQQHG